jgi:nitrogen-specific signal transduction histidine kinase
MNIAIIGSGTECIQIIDFFKTRTYTQIQPVIVGFANPKGDPACLAEIACAGIPFAEDYRTFFERDDINLILDLTNDSERYQEVLTHKKPSVRAMNYETSRLFLDMYRIYGDDGMEAAERGFLQANSIYKIIMNDVVNEDVLVIAPNHQIMDANDALLKKVGLRREEIIGRNCYEVTHRYGCPCDQENCPCPLKETLLTLRPFSTTHIHLDKDNLERHVSISCYPLMGPKGILGAVEISKDITRDVLMQRSMMQQEKLASIGRLSAGVAHEINNPLTTVLTTAMLLQEDAPPNSPLFQELETIVKETIRCRSIVTALLDFARQKTPQMRECSVNDIVANTVTLTRKQSAFKDIGLDVLLDPRAPLLWADPQQITQALIILIVNAIESTEAGGRISLVTGFDPSGGCVRIQVKDTGTGILPEILTQVFEPFFTTKESGTGLGLSVAHGIIVQHGGRIEVDSQPQQGSTFTIVLPLRKGA